VQRPLNKLDANIDIASLAQSYSDLIARRIEHRGKADAVSYFKTLHQIGTKLVLKDSSLTVLPFTKTNKSGVPRALLPLIPLFMSSDVEIQRLGLTITRFYESIVLKPTFDPAPITEPGVALDKSFLEDFKVFLE